MAASEQLLKVKGFNHSALFGRNLKQCVLNFATEKNYKNYKLKVVPRKRQKFTYVAHFLTEMSKYFISTHSMYKLNHCNM